MSFGDRADDQKNTDLLSWVITDFGSVAGIARWFSEFRDDIGTSEDLSVLLSTSVGPNSTCQDQTRSLRDLRSLLSSERIGARRPVSCRTRYDRSIRTRSHDVRPSVSINVCEDPVVVPLKGSFLPRFACRQTRANVGNPAEQCSFKVSPFKGRLMRVIRI